MESPSWNHYSQTLHVLHIYLHWGGFTGLGVITKPKNISPSGQTPVGPRPPSVAPRLGGVLVVLRHDVTEIPVAAEGRGIPGNVEDAQRVKLPGCKSHL